MPGVTCPTGARADRRARRRVAAARGIRPVGALRAALLLTAGAAIAAIAGCSQHRPAWHDEPRSATLAYWHDRPAVARVESSQYGALWDAADGARRRFGFDVALADYRGGLLTGAPHPSPQPFEVWRDERL